MLGKAEKSFAYGGVVEKHAARPLRASFAERSRDVKLRSEADYVRAGAKFKPEAELN